MTRGGGGGARRSLSIRELWIRAHRGLGKIPVVLNLLGLSSSLQCTTKPSNFSLWGEKVVFLASWGGLLISRRDIPTEMLPPNLGVLIHNWRFLWHGLTVMRRRGTFPYPLGCLWGKVIFRCAHGLVLWLKAPSGDQ